MTRAAASSMAREYRRDAGGSGRSASVAVCRCEGRVSARARSREQVRGLGVYEASVETIGSPATTAKDAEHGLAGDAERFSACRHYP